MPAVPFCFPSGVYLLINPWALVGGKPDLRDVKILEGDSNHQLLVYEWLMQLAPEQSTTFPNIKVTTIEFTFSNTAEENRETTGQAIVFGPSTTFSCSQFQQAYSIAKHLKYHHNDIPEFWISFQILSSFPGTSPSTMTYHNGHMSFGTLN